MPDSLFEDILQLFALEWFLPETFEEYHWDNPTFLYALVLLPVVFLGREIVAWRYRQRLEIALSSDHFSDPIAILRHLQGFFFASFLAFVVLALARPQRTDEKVERETEGIDIILALDLSESMEARDLHPNRLEKVKRTALKFIDGRFQDRIGVVIFAEEAYSLSPLTTDYDLLRTNIEADVRFGRISGGGTAIGSALGVAINRMKSSKSKSKVIILLSDGENTAGNLDPKMAAQLAQDYHIKIHTIAVGRQGPVQVPSLTGMQLVQNAVDTLLLREIAEIGKGHYFKATDNRALENIFKKIDTYEKAEIKETRFKDIKDYYRIYLSWGIICFLIWLGLKNTFISNALED